MFILFIFTCRHRLLFSPNSGDCITTLMTSADDPLLDTTVSELYRSSSASAGGREWSPPSTISIGDIFLGSRTRPASYGRASSWAVSADTSSTPSSSSSTTTSFSSTNGT